MSIHRNVLFLSYFRVVFCYTDVLYRPVSIDGHLDCIYPSATIKQRCNNYFLIYTVVHTRIFMSDHSHMAKEINILFWRGGAA